MRKWSYENLAESKESGQSTIDSTQSLCQLVIADAIPNEVYTFETDSLFIQASKISYDDNDYNDYCGNNHVILSDDYTYDVSLNGSTNIDCTLMITNDNLYLLSLIAIEQSNSSKSFETDFVLLDLVPETQSASATKSNNYSDSIDNILLSKSDNMWDKH